jgi:hypothetical protein
MSLVGYRKFIIAALFAIAATALCAAGKINGGEFVAVAGLVTGLYGAANAAGKFGKSAPP